jgi:murein DD-endopeptidase MepM/ murein hydrolase activator NlpD
MFRVFCFPKNIFRVFFFSILFLFPACVSQRPQPDWLPEVPDAEAIGIYHKVKTGQTLYSICKMYSADLQEVAEINGIDDPRQLRLHQVVFIPDAKRPKETKRVAHASKTAPATRKNKESITRYHGKFIWPVDGVVTSKFGIRAGRRHDGIDIGAPQGTSIHAAAAGRILHVGFQKGYGNLVIIMHSEKLITVYAHNHKNFCKEGESVKQGQIIGEVGQTGRATGPHVHFEIRKGKKPRNPLFFLPRP